MRKVKSMIALLGAMSLVASLGVGCGQATQTSSSGSETKSTDSAEQTDEIKEFSMYIAMPGTETPEDNRVYNEITKRIGAKAKMTYLTGQTAKESIGTMVAGGDYTDFIVGSDGTSLLVDAGALIPIDEYWDNYPNVKNFLSESDWNKIRAEDGHVYLIPQFGTVNEKDMQTYHNDEAFWIQIRVLEWANYPKINTLDEYFDLIERYIEANPTMDDGLENIGYEILSDDWRYYCLENPPLFLDGYPNDGCCFVDPETLTAHNYNTTDTAKAYFKKLNEEYAKGIIDPETFTINYDQYIAKLSTGRVCGMVDQFWNFQDAERSLISQGLDDCTYVPVGVVLKDGTIERYHSAPALDVSNGLSITTSCKDVEGAMKMIDDMLSLEIQTLRMWGMEGIDYEVGDDGVFYRTEEQRKKALDKDFQINELCQYTYFPYHSGMSLDGINAGSPAQQPSEYYASQTAAKKKVLDAYGLKTFTEFLNPSQENSDWYPMWSYTNTWTADTDYGLAKVNMDEVKHEWLPKVVMAGDFESAWDQYMKVFNERVDVEAYENALTEEVQRRVAVAKGETTNE
nr:extracellular solute-binding protein [uncultured Cellulosilyticum sp.]